MSDQSHELALGTPVALSPPAALSAGATRSDSADPGTTSDSVHRVSAARTRLMNRLLELERRITHTKERFNIASHIRAQPLAAVGASLAVGATVGLLRGGRAPGPWASKLIALLSGLAMDVAKNQLRGWASQHLGGGTNANTAAAARPTSANAPA